jgi:DNA-binding PadR family transcriptional regulator
MNDLKNLVSPHEPLTETTYLILLCLAPGAQHGYAIMKDVAALSENRVQISTGTLYGALSRLLEQGWIEPVETQQPIGSKRLRKAYQLTSVGQHVLKREVARLSRLVQAARLRHVEE